MTIQICNFSCGKYKRESKTRAEPSLPSSGNTSPSRFKLTSRDFRAQINRSLVSLWTPWNWNEILKKKVNSVERTVFLICDTGTTRYLYAKKWTLTHTLCYIQKLTQNVSIKYKTTKLSEENIEGTNHDFELGQKFLYMIPKRIKNYEFDIIEIKNFCSAKFIVKRKKRQVTCWRKVFAVDLYPEYVKNSQNSKIRKQWIN